MYQIIYVSGSSGENTKLDLVEILTQSRRNNVSRGVTGMLFSYRESYLQVLEGGEAEVRDIARTIRDDGRHDEFTILFEDEVSRKLFGQWSMGYVDADAARNLVNSYVPPGTPQTLLQLDLPRTLQMLEFFQIIVGDGLPRP